MSAPHTRRPTPSSEERIRMVIDHMGIRGDLAPEDHATLPAKIMEALGHVADDLHPDYAYELFPRVVRDLEAAESEESFWRVLRHHGVVEEAEAIEAELAAVERRRRRLYERIRPLLDRFHLEGVDRDTAAEDLARNAEEDGTGHQLVHELANKHAGDTWDDLCRVLRRVDLPSWWPQVQYRERWRTTA